MGMVSHYTKMRNWNTKTLNTDRVKCQSRTDHYDYKVHEMAHDMMLQAKRMQTNALDVDVRLFYLYTRLTSGRRCCCFKGVNQEPKGDCGICFGTGVVGGFEKFGTHTEVIDPSRRCVCVNVKPDITNSMLPVCFRLEDDCLEGYILSDVEIGNNVGEIDFYKVYTSYLNNNANCIVYVKAYGSDDSTYYYSHIVRNGGEVTEYKIENRIEELLRQGVRKLTFKIVLRRTHLEIESPLFSHLYLRYRVRPANEYTLKCDTTPAQNAALFDINGGSSNSWTNLTVIADPNVFENYTADDFLYDFERDVKWKIYQVEKKKQVDVVTQIQLEITLLQEYEKGYQLVPI